MDPSFGLPQCWLPQLGGFFPGDDLSDVRGLEPLASLGTYGHMAVEKRMEMCAEMKLKPSVCVPQSCRDTHLFWVQKWFLCALIKFRWAGGSR